MAIYDRDGTTNYEIGKVYDNNGTTNSQIGKVYDNNGTTNSLIYNSEFYFFGNGSLYGSWSYAYSSGAIDATGWYASCSNSYITNYCTTQIDFSQYDTLEIYTTGFSHSNAQSWDKIEIGIASSVGTCPTWVKYFSFPANFAAGTYTLDISDVTGTYYFALHIHISGTGKVTMAKLY